MGLPGVWIAEAGPDYLCLGADNKLYQVRLALRLAPGQLLAGCMWLTICALGLYQVQPLLNAHTTCCWHAHLHCLFDCVNGSIMAQFGWDVFPHQALAALPPVPHRPPHKMLLFAAVLSTGGRPPHRSYCGGAAPDPGRPRGSCRSDAPRTGPAQPE